MVAVAWRAWSEEVAFAEQFVAGSPDLAVRSPMQDGTTVALREVILHMVEGTPATSATPTCSASGLTAVSASNPNEPGADRAALRGRLSAKQARSTRTIGQCDTIRHHPSLRHHAHSRRSGES